MTHNWLYENNSDNSARYILGQKGSNPLVCVGINPSTAEPDNLDRTLTNVRTFSQIHGYDGWLMLNVYPQRATYPDDLHCQLDTSLHQTNVNMIVKYLKEYKRVDIWAAWGTIINKRKYLAQALHDITQGLSGVNARWIKIGKLSTKGHPHHPLYLSHKSGIESFDIKGYIKNLTVK